MRRPALLTVALLVPSWATGCLLEKGATGITQKPEAQRTALPSDAAHRAAPRISANTYLAAGMMLEKQGDLPGAAEQYERAVAAAPRQASGYNRLGILYQKLGRTADADHIFKQGLRAAPDSHVLHNNFGFSQLSQKKLDAAESAFRQALKLSPGFKRARMNLAIVLAQTGRLEESVVEFGRVVPPDVAKYNVAVICYNKKDHRSAERWLREALAINPDCPGAADALRRIAPLARSRGSGTTSDPPLSPPQPVVVHPDSHEHPDEP